MLNPGTVCYEDASGNTQAVAAATPLPVTLSLLEGILEGLLHGAAGLVVTEAGTHVGRTWNTASSTPLRIVVEFSCMGNPPLAQKTP